MNWTDQMRRERGRQIDLSYDDTENDLKRDEEWDQVMQHWWTFLLQAQFAGDLTRFRRVLLQMLTMAAAWGAAQQRLASKYPDEGDGWHITRGLS